MEPAIDDLIKVQKQKLEKFNSTNIFSRNKWLIATISAALIIVFFASRLYVYVNVPKLEKLATQFSETREQSSPSGKVEVHEPFSTESAERSIPAKITLLKTDGWKVYADRKLGFTFKYPSNYFLNLSDLSKNIKNGETSKLVFELSSGSKFDDDQFATVISGYKTSEASRSSSIEWHHLVTESLKNSLKVEITEDFTGNPPWGYYIINIPLSSPPGSYLEIAARIHHEYEQGDLQVFNSVLSTFNFLK